MMKKMIPAAALLVLAGAAQAQVTPYGLIDVSYGKNETLDDVDGHKNRFHSGGDNGNSQGNSTTRVGLKGSFDVAPGYKGNFQLETGGITRKGQVNGKSFFNRQAWAGVSGGFGEVRVGRQDSVLFQNAIAFDLNGAANAASATAAAGLAGGIWGDGRVSNNVQYMAPAFGGVKLHAGYAPENASDGVTKSFASLAASYAAGPLGVVVATEGKRTANSENKVMGAVSYDFKVAKAVWNHSFTKGAKGDTIGVVAPVAGVNVGVQYANNSTTKVKAVEYFVNKEVFKNTYAYLDYGVQNPAGAGADKKAYALGVIYTF